MASLTIRNLDDELKRRLRIRAAEHGRSMEEEARDILRLAVGKPEARRNLANAIRSHFAPLGGIEIDLPVREPMCEPSQLTETVGRSLARERLLLRLKAQSRSNLDASSRDDLYDV